MPESLVLAKFYREMENPPFKVQSKSNTMHGKCIIKDDACYLSRVGRFIVHKDCCAQVAGNRQTFILHRSLPIDALFEQLPDSSTSSRPAVDIVGGLSIEGDLIAAFRGKELVFGIDKVIVHYSYV